MKLTTRLAALVAAVLLLLVGFSASASAQPHQYPPTTCAQVTVSATIVPPGGHLTIAGSGFTPGANLTIEWHSAVVVLAQVTADANGTFNVVVTAPSDAVGNHTITVTGDSNVNVCPIDPIHVTSNGNNGGHKHRPSSTGVAVAGLLLLGGALVVAGFVFSASGRRHSHRARSDFIG